MTGAKLYSLSRALFGGDLGVDLEASPPDVEDATPLFGDRNDMAGLGAPGA